MRQYQLKEDTFRSINYDLNPYPTLACGSCTSSLQVQHQPCSINIMDRPEGQILTGIDSGLAEGSQSVLLDIDPEISLDFLKAAAKFAGKRPPKRASREQLEKTHNEHLKSLVRNETTPRTVKKIILSLAYSPSSKSIRELEKVRIR